MPCSSGSKYGAMRLIGLDDQRRAARAPSAPSPSRARRSRCPRGKSALPIVWSTWWCVLSSRVIGFGATCRASSSSARVIARREQRVDGRRAVPPGDDAPHWRCRTPRSPARRRRRRARVRSCRWTIPSCRKVSEVSLQWVVHCRCWLCWRPSAPALPTRLRARPAAGTASPARCSRRPAGNGACRARRCRR